MEYNGFKLIEMSPENWDGKSREMLVWDDNSKNPIDSSGINRTKANTSF